VKLELAMLVIMVGMVTLIPVVIILLGFIQSLFANIKSRKWKAPDFSISFLVLVIPILLYLFIPSLRANPPNLSYLSQTDTIMLLAWFGLIIGSFVIEIWISGREDRRKKKEQAQFASEQKPVPFMEVLTEEQTKNKIDELVNQGSYGYAFNYTHSFGILGNYVWMNYLARKLIEVINDPNTQPSKANYAIKVLRDIKENCVIVDQALEYEIINIIDH
jgi:hypothetical protein